jgi:phosphoribosylformimino-5-aminoimidazole carboxamide ribotide isomerase
MAILPVLDLMQGQIVRAIAGRREEYRPIVSRLAASPEPLAVARAFRAHFGFTEFYLADLDAIEHGFADVETYSRLQSEGFRLWIDAGLRWADDPATSTLIEQKEATIVIGLESVEGPAELERLVARIGAERAVFSLDMKGGRPLGRAELWQTADPWSIAQRAMTAGITRLIVLDLAQVGVGAGVGTEDLCRRLKIAYPNVQLTAGGGVRGIDDVRRLEECGVDFVLVASALHDGRITPRELSPLSPPGERGRG